MSALYRVRQFVRATGAWAQPGQLDETLVRRYLPPAGERLFQAMPAYDRRHGLLVLHTLRQQGHTGPDLLAAALLHDVGKTAVEVGRLRLWHRVAVVLMRAATPALLGRLGSERSAGWRQAFYVQQHHATLGAELAQQAGCSARTVALIRDHEDPPAETDDPLLAALRAVDNSS